MSKRLVKIAKELNVGTTTIVEHLLGKGFQIENKPTAKVSDEMYDILCQDFQKSMAIKEQADQLTIGLRKKKEEEDAAAAALIIERAAPVVEEVPEPVVEENNTPEPVVEEVVVVKEEVPPVVEEEVVAPKEEVPPVVKKDEVIRAEGPEFKVVGKIDLKEVNRKASKKKKKEPAKQEPKKQGPVAKKQQTPAKEQPKKKEPVVVEAKKKELAIPAKKDDIHVTVTPQLKGLKILGKIDTDRLSKPKKKKTTGQDAKGKPGQKGTNSSEEAKKKRKRKRKKIVSNTGSGSNNNRGGSRNNKRGAKKDEVKEVSKKEVEAQIKATMAKMTGGGKNKRQKIRREERVKRREKQDTLDQELENEDKSLQVTEFIAVSELANLFNVAASQIIMTCMNLGVIVSINQRLDAEVIELVAGEYEYEVEFISAEEQIDSEEDDWVDAPEDLEMRAPIVTVMGHVDHGKTSLLDFIREANVVDGEAGGITQHIGAYEVKVGENKKKITFLDTPGHEAFTAMRARGAKVTDIAVIIIAADDSIMPQTKEAISHAQAAGVPIVFAINKIDKEGSRPEKIKEQLAGMNLLVEDWGGTFQSQEISAKTGLNIDLLLEKIILEAEMLALTANENRPAVGAVLEASLDKGRGYVCKILVQTGSLAIGDPVVAGGHSGKVKAMFNERGQRVKKVGPSTPVLVLGLDGAPQAGEKFKVMPNEQEARQLATKRSQINREQQQRATKRLSLEDIGRRLALGSFKELNLIVKGDFDGSVEALSDSLQKLSIESVQVNIVHKAVGQIIESDILLASASDAIIIGFQVRPSAGARKIAEREGVQIKTYSIIYAAIEEVKHAIEGMLEPTKEEKIVCTVQVREIYKIRKLGTIAGCIVQEGVVHRNTSIRLIRDGIVIYPTKENVKGELASLKRFKDDVREVKQGIECGMSVKNYNDIKVDDIIEGYEIVEVKQRL